MSFRQRGKISLDRKIVVYLIPILLGFFLWACSTVPLTGRSQINLISQPTLMKMSMDSYKEVLSKSKLSKDKKKVAQVKRVGNKIARAAERFLRDNGLAGDISNYAWEFNLIEDDKTANAWCMPGGKIAVYTGILPITQNEEGLAAVMGTRSPMPWPNTVMNA